MPRLLIHHASEGSRVFELLGDRPISIGRAKSSNLLLDHPSVSRLHAVVHSTPDGHWNITDRESSNGVKVNGTAVKEAVLRPNDEITVGEYRLLFEDSQSRNVITYGTTEFPRRFAQTLNGPAYAGSAMAVEPVAGAAAPESGRANMAERVRSLEHENRLLKLLYRVNQALNTLSSVSEVTQRVLDFVLEIEGAERGYAMLLDEASVTRGDFSSGYGFEPAIIRYRASSQGQPVRGAPQLAMSQSIIRQVMKANLPLLVSDAQADPRLSASQSVVNAGIQSAMCAPLGMGDRLRGILYVDNLSRRGMFTVDDLNVFGVIAVQAGLAIDRVRARKPLPEKASE
jgi:two-component system, NtrC family, sensor kinase